MSIREQVAEHDRNEATFAMYAVRELQSGQAWLAEQSMASAARERHLAFELNDTAEIAWAALMELWDERRAA